MTPLRKLLNKTQKEFNESFWYFLANNLPRLSFFNRFRARVLSFGGVVIGNNVTIWSGFDTSPIGCGKNLIIGDEVFINKNFRCAIPNGSTITIGDNCAIGPNVSIETVNHNVKWTTEYKWGGGAKSVIIGEKCWVGAGSIILGGVSIGSYSVIAAGSVVTKNVPENVIVAGVPAKIIKKLHDENIS